MDGVGMDERDLEAEEPRAWNLVDQLCTGLGELGESHADVVDLVRDVVHSGPAAREEPSDRSVGETSSMRSAPTSRDIASTPWSGTVERCSTSAPKSRL